MKVLKITSWQDLTDLKSQWNLLLKNSPANCIFLTWEWIETWYQCNKNSISLFVLIVTNKNGQVLGIAPFYQAQYTFLNLFHLSTLRVFGEQATGSEYLDILADNQHIDGVYAAIFEYLKNNNEWDLIWIPKMSAWNNGAKRLSSAASRTPLYFISRPHIFSVIHLPNTTEKYLNGFSTKHRQQLLRKTKKTLNNTNVTINRCTDASELSAYIQDLFNLHHQRRQLLGDSGSFIRKPNEAEFYKMFIPLALKNGWLLFFKLSESGVTKAIQIGYVYNNTFHQLQEGFDPTFTPGVGNTLRLHTVEYCIQNNILTYDFLGQQTEHKRRWQAQKRIGCDVFIGRKTLLNRIIFSNKIWPTGRYLTPK